jgi:hypothetical protein
MRELILIHGRSQQGKDAGELKKTWVAALAEGIAGAGLQLDIDDAHVHLPFYGNTLSQLIDKSETVESVVIKGGKDSVGDAEAQLMAQVVGELLSANGITLAQVSAEQSPDEIAVRKKGPLNWGWVLTALRLLNSAGLGTLALELCTRDVYQYVYDPSIKKEINDGVAAAFTKQEAVVVAHSLGTVVAYSLLSDLGSEKGWEIPAFVTLGSPLAIHAVNQLLPSLAMPSCVGTWYNGRDPKDTVALFPLAPDHFPDLGIIPKDNINNRSDNHHGIEEYLRDRDVASWIHAALTS